MAWTSKRVKEKMREESNNGSRPSSGGSSDGGRPKSPQVETDITRLLDAIERGCYPTALQCFYNLEDVSSMQGGSSISKELLMNCGCSTCVPIPKPDSSTAGSELRPPMDAVGGRDLIRKQLSSGLSDQGKFQIIRALLNRLTSGHTDEENLRYRLKSISIAAFLVPISPKVEKKTVDYMVNFPLSVNRSAIHGFMVSFVDFLVSLKSPIPDDCFRTLSGNKHDDAIDEALPFGYAVMPESKDSSPAERIERLKQSPPELLRADWFVPCDVAMRSCFDATIVRLNGAGYYSAEMGDEAPAHHRWAIRRAEELTPTVGGSKANRANSGGVLCGELLFHGSSDLLDLFEVMLRFPTLAAAKVISHSLMQALLRIKRDGGFAVEELNTALALAKGILYPHPYIRTLRLYRRLFEFFGPLMSFQEAKLAAASPNNQQAAEGQEVCEEVSRVPSFVPLRHASDRPAVHPYFLALVVKKVTGLEELYTAVEPFVAWEIPSRLFYQLLQLREVLG